MSNVKFEKVTAYKVDGEFYETQEAAMRANAKRRIGAVAFRAIRKIQYDPNIRFATLESGYEKALLDMYDLNPDTFLNYLEALEAKYGV